MSENVWLEIKLKSNIKISEKKILKVSIYFILGFLF